MKKENQPKLIIGIDEAGRGPLAGPVSVAAVLVNRDLFKKVLKEEILVGLTDSKKLSENRRETLFKKIKELEKAEVLKFSVTLIGAGIIDRRGISFALKLGIKRILRRLQINPKEVSILLDGSLYAPDTFINQKTIIRGDFTEPIISAASIIAKVHRDHYMKRISHRFPKYDFEIHKGYGTRDHIKKIRKYGISKFHRKSFCKNI